MNHAVNWFLAITFNSLLIVNARVVPSRDTLTSTSASSSLYSRPPCERPGKFDELRLAIEWIPGVCLELNRTGDRTCESVADEFIIHGLWPSRVNSTDQNNCCTRKFELSNIKHLVPRLEKSWKSIYDEDANGKFWSHEWYKHGSCAKSVHLLNGQANYFNWTLTAFEKLPIKSWLESARVVPNSKVQYDLVKLHKAIQSRTGSKVYFNCKRKKSEAILTGLILCFDPKTLNLTNCVRPDDSICGRSKVKFISSTSD